MTPRSLNSSSSLEFTLLLFGGAAGYVAAWWLHGFGFSNPGELAAAREAGIVSETVLGGYPKSRDTYNYLIALLLPALCAIVCHRLGHRRSSLGSRLADSGFSAHSFTHLAYWLGMTIIILWSWHSTLIVRPGWSPSVGAWPFLGEQGASLAWLHSLGSGGVYGRDFFSLYGPMFIYPLHWLIDLTGNQAAMMERYYKFVLQVTAFGLLAFIFLRTLRHRALAWFFAIGLTFLYPALFSPSANSNNLRTALPLFALVSLALWIDTRRVRWRWISGLVLGQSLLFSQEAGLCALASGSAVLFLDEFARSARTLKALQSVGILWGITLASMSPMLVFLLANGAGAALLDSLIGYPRLVMLGFGAFPFPSLRDGIGEEFMEVWHAYAVIGIYSGSAIALALAWHKGVRSPRLFLGIGLTLFGAVLFRQALGRSDTDQILKVMLPALLLMTLWLDEARQYLTDANATTGSRAIAVAMVALLLVNFFVGICKHPLVIERVKFGWTAGTSLDGKFRTSPALAREPIDKRIGFQVDPGTRLTINEIDDFLNRQSSPGESIYFFPNEAAYYYLFNRPNPTRYAISYFATPFERQLEVIGDLERNRPRFVVFSKQTWRIDDIPESVQVPLIVDYLRRHYHLLESRRTVDIFQRN